MLGPQSSGRRSKRKVDDDWAWRSDESPGENAECELCQSRTNTTVQYGMRVCASCDEQLLP